MLTIKYQAAFKRDYKRIVKRGYSSPTGCLFTK